jgi:hypothetical protein
MVGMLDIIETMRSKSSYEGAVHGLRGISQGVRKLARTCKVIKKRKRK